MDSSSAKSPAQATVDKLGPVQSHSTTSHLFRANRTYHFDLASEYTSSRKTQSVEEQEDKRIATLEAAYEYLLDPDYGRADKYESYISKRFSDEAPVFVTFTENGWQWARDLNWLEGYLYSVASFFNRDQTKEDDWGTCVLMRPILKGRNQKPVGYYVSPAEVSVVAKSWTDAGFRAPSKFNPPLYPQPADHYIGLFTSPSSGKFAVPSELATCAPGQLTYYWCKFAELSFPDDKPAPLAVPIQPFSFGDVSGRININIGGSATQDVSDFVPPTMDLPLTTDQLKYVARGGRDYFGDHPVAEPDNKLAAAIGTAVAAAITVGVAAALS